MAVTGESWRCPHCGERILRSAVICPVCQRRLHVDALAASSSAQVTVSPLNIEGVIRNPDTEAASEYSVFVEVRDQKGDVLAKRIVGVGAIHPGESRVFTLRVEMQSPDKVPSGMVSSRPHKVA